MDSHIIEGFQEAILSQCRFELKNYDLCFQMSEMSSVYEGAVYVVKDNIDTDQIIPAQYLNLVPTIPEEYKKLGSFALIGLPEELYLDRYVKEGQLNSDYPIVIAGRNFGCGSSREHAPIALGSAGCKVVLAESFAVFFFGTVLLPENFILVILLSVFVKY